MAMRGPNRTHMSTPRAHPRQGLLVSLLVLSAAVAMGGRAVHCWVIRPSIRAENKQQLRVTTPPSSGASSASTAMPMSSRQPPDQGDLLERARLLREEAQAMEDSLRGVRASRSASATGSIKGTAAGGVTASPSPTRGAVPSYTQLEDSVWTLSYRFSSQPAPQEEDQNDEGRSSSGRGIGERQTVVPRTSYSGRVTLRFRGDGYSEQVLPTASTGGSAEDDATSNHLQRRTRNEIKISKVWGWDRETSNEDGQDYLVFSVDVLLPESDPHLPNQSERFYFQARVETSDGRDGNKALALKDGIITVKKDVADATKGRWGLFNVAGILTRFRYVGDFVAKPSDATIL